MAIEISRGIELGDTGACSAPIEVPCSAASMLAQASLDRLDQACQWIDESIGVEAPPIDLPLSIIIPVYNEQATVAAVLDAVRALPIVKQIIVVDDGSTDGTRSILERYANCPDVEVFLHVGNQGKGAALQSGFRLAMGEVVIVQDADLEYNPSDILRVIQPILDGRSDVVYGSRYLENHGQDSSWFHRFGNQVLTLLSNCMTRNRLTDMETCYKAIRRDVLKSLSIQQKRFGFEPEITAKLARQGHRILEVPVSYQSRSWKEGKKIGLRDLINALWCILRYRFS